MKTPLTSQALSQSLFEQPFDDLLLQKSRLYRQSRKLFLAQKGCFVPRLLTSARSLGSATLIKNEIEYTPLATEIEWSRVDCLQRHDTKHAALLQSLITGIYHEQNHRILWQYFKKSKIYCPDTRKGAYSFLNLAESLVIVMDMALGDELDPQLGSWLYQVRGIYNPGEPFMRKLRVGSQAYQQALLICLYTTFLRLEGLHPEDIPGTIHRIFHGRVWQGQGKNLTKVCISNCIKRAMKIEPMFVDITNPVWQKKHVQKVIDAFGPPRGKLALSLPDRKPNWPGGPRGDEIIALIARGWFQIWL